MENKTNKFAIASVILGILSIPFSITIIFSIICGVLAIVFGAISKNDVTESNQSNKGLGIAGIVTGSVGIFVTLLLIIISIVVVINFRNKEEEKMYNFNKSFYNEYFNNEFDKDFKYDFDFNEFFPESYD